MIKKMWMRICLVVRPGEWYEMYDDGTVFHAVPLKGTHMETGLIAAMVRFIIKSNMPKEA